jgi:hypothetical protein
VFFGYQFLRVIALYSVVSTLAHTGLPVTLFTQLVLVFAACIALGSRVLALLIAVRWYVTDLRA